MTGNAQFGSRLFERAPLGAENELAVIEHARHRGVDPAAEPAALSGDIDEGDRGAVDPVVPVHDLTSAERARRCAGRAPTRRADFGAASACAAPWSERPLRHWMAIARLATPSSPVTGGGCPSLMALTKAISSARSGPAKPTERSRTESTPSGWKP